MAEGTNYSDTKSSSTVTMTNSEYAFVNNKQQQQQEHKTSFNRPQPIWKFIPSFMRLENAPTEVTGLGLDEYGRSTIILCSAFIGPALLDLATAAAQEASCSSLLSNSSSSEIEIEECLQNARIYGFRPSSLLTNMVTISGLAITLLLPVFGAIIDHTPYRRQVGIAMAVGSVLIRIIQGILLLSKSWLEVSILEILSQLLMDVFILVGYAYSIELSDDPSERSTFQTYFAVVMCVSMIIFLLEVLIPGVLFGFDENSLTMAKWSIVVAVVPTSISFSVVWKYLMPNRPALSLLPNGQTLLSCGVFKLKSTLEQIRSENSALYIFLLSVTFAEGADTALSVVATTLMSQHLLMSSGQIGLAILCFLIGGIPGSLVGDVISDKINPLFSVKTCLVLFMVVTGVGAFVLKPEMLWLTFIFSFLWGICQGWLHPQNTTVAMTIAPKGQDAEIMGLFLFACQILAWLPPLVFTILNERQKIDAKWGLASLNIYFLITFVGLQFMGSFENALQFAQNNQQVHVAAAVQSGDNDTEEPFPSETRKILELV